jgi:glycerate kinase
MKILIAPDSFKESLKANDVAKYIEEGIRLALPEAECIRIPLADGGEGTVDALVNASGGKIEKVKVMDPLMREIESYFGIMGDGNTAVIEMAAASGIELLEKKERDPMRTTSYGTGQLIREALNKGCSSIIIGIGGSATNDGGAGMAQALGIKLLDKNRKSIGNGGGQLNYLKFIEDMKLDKRVKETRILVACDVKNPLCGENGASRVYGPQKGATEKIISILDQNLNHFGDLLEAKYKNTIKTLPGAGAAGGLGAGLAAFLDAELMPGFDIIEKITRLEKVIIEVDLVITGEGKMDEQTKFGKTPHGIAQLAKKYNKPVIGIAGSLGYDYQKLYNEGFDVLVSIIDKPMSLEMALRNASEMLKFTAYNLLRSMDIGSGLK